MDAEGGNIQRLTEDPAPELEAEWGPSAPQLLTGIPQAPTVTPNPQQITPLPDTPTA